MALLVRLYLTAMLVGLVGFLTLAVVYSVTDSTVVFQWARLFAMMVLPMLLVALLYVGVGAIWLIN